MDNEYGWLNDLNLESEDSNNDTGEMYEDLTSLLVGSHYMTFKTTAYHALKDILKTKDNTIKNANLTDLQQFPKENVTIHDIINKSLGRIEDILFWNDPQRLLYQSLKKFEHTIVTGDYGVGKTVIALAFADYCCNHPEVRKVHFISALDYEADNHNTNKLTDDIFDVIMKDRLSGTEKVQFVSLARLRQNLYETSKDSKKVSKKEKRVRKQKEKKKELWTDNLLSDYLATLGNTKEIVVIIDEFHLNWRYKSDSNKGKDPIMIDVLKRLKDSFKMAVIVLSTSSLLDKTDIRPEKFFLFDQTDFKFVELTNIMRNSQAVSNASSVASINSYRDDVQIEETISPGRVSTIQGVRPKCIIFPLIKKDKTVQYKVMAECIKMYFENIQLNVPK